ncbi:MAG: rRNA methyltransferase, partial [Rhizobacter sp.]|nr:rRNA methyltransferase [Rhizobacter sp.]
LAYSSLMQKWNKAINLTAVRDPSQMLVQHLLDSLSVVAPLRRALGDRPARILDVGSGGGLPGVVLAIVEPTWTVACVDAVGKKVAFIRQVAAELLLRNLSGVHARVETLKPERAYDLITSRAFASLNDFATLTASLGDESTIWAAMKGKTPTDEMAALPTEFAVFHVEQLTVPELDADRCIVWMRKTSTP